MEIVTATDMQNNLGKYLNMVISGLRSLLPKMDMKLEDLSPKDKSISYLTDSLTGILKKESDFDKIKSESLNRKYGIAD